MKRQFGCFHSFYTGDPIYPIRAGDDLNVLFDICQSKFLPVEGVTCLLIAGFACPLSPRQAKFYASGPIVAIQFQGVSIGVDP